MSTSTTTAPLWRPSAAQIESAHMTALMREATKLHAETIDDYGALWRWSIERPAEFWSLVWDYCSVVSSARGECVLRDGDLMPGARWFPDARLNFAENLLQAEDNATAIIFWNERGVQQHMTFGQLRDDVARVARWLRGVGVGQGDRVAAFLPNMPAAVVTMLAAASIGAVFSSCSPDFGVEAVVERFSQIEPTVLVTADGYRYGGNTFDSLARVREFSSQLPTLQQTLVVPYLQPMPALEGLVGPTRWDDLPAGGELEFAQLPFDHPLYILYSSGTTGVPKCIVHSAGGTLLQHLKEHQFHTNVSPGDRLFYFTTCGWMMWNWLVSGLASGAAIVLYDGAPFCRRGRLLFEMVDAEEIDVFGTSASFLAALEKLGATPGESYRLDSLRTILSTGSPLAAEGFDFVYEKIKRDVCLSSISGGTDIVSCFALGNPTAPVWRGELQCRGLGMAVDVFDDAGQTLREGKGELVCTVPFPSMPVGFWNDPDGSRYHNAYFARFPGVWHHGDFAELTPHDGMIIHGRSDAVLNPGGVRIGTAEIYRQVGLVPEVVESIAVGQQWQGDVRVVLFVRLRDGITLDDELIGRIKSQIRAGASPRHVPAVVLQVTDIPRTRSGKIVELAVRDAMHGRPVKNLNAMANPEALQHFRDRPELAANGKNR